MAKQNRLGGALDDIAEHHHIKRLLYEVVGPTLQRGLGRWNIAVGRDQNCFGVRLMGLGQFQNIKTTGGRIHDKVGDNHIEIAVAKLIFRLRGVVHDGANMTRALQSVSHGLGVLHLVVDE